MSLSNSFFKLDLKKKKNLGNLATQLYFLPDHENQRKNPFNG